MVGFRKRIEDIYNQLSALYSRISKGYYLSSHFAQGSLTGGIQEALDQAVKKPVFMDTLEHPLQDTITIDSYDSLNGFGYYSVMKAMNNLNKPCITVSDGATNFKLNNFRIDGNRANQASGDGINIANSCSNAIMRRLFINSCKNYAIRLFRGIGAKPYLTRILNCYFEDIEAQTIYMADNTMTKIIGNVFNNNVHRDIQDSNSSTLLQIINNQFYEPSIDAIYLSGNGCMGLVKGNQIWNGSSSGISLAAYDTTQVLNNFVFTCAGHGIRINGSENQILNNRCHDGGAGMAGIYIEATSHNNLIMQNFSVKGVGANQSYGIRLTVNTYDNVVKSNRCYWNAIANYLDEGDNKWKSVFFWYPEANDITHNVLNAVLTDGSDITRYLTLKVPDDFQELIKCDVLVKIGGTGNMRWDAVTQYGRANHSEVYNTHNDGVPANDQPVTLDYYARCNLNSALDDLGRGDIITGTFTRYGSHLNDTVGANCWLIGIELKYV